MNADEIALLCNALSIKEKECNVRTLDESLKEIGERCLALCLVGKIMKKKLVNRDVCIEVMNKIWRVYGGVEIEPVEGNIFAFYFKNRKDMQRILRGGHWNFDQAIIVFDKPTEMGLVVFCRLGCVRIGRKMDECTEDGEYNDLSLEANRRLGAWLRATSPPKRRYMGQGRKDNRNWGRYIGTWGSRSLGDRDSRVSGDWRGKRPISVGRESDDDQHEIGPARSRRKEESCQPAAGCTCIEAEMEPLSGGALNEHGENKMSGSKISSSSSPKNQILALDEERETNFNYDRPDNGDNGLNGSGEKDCGASLDKKETCHDSLIQTSNFKHSKSGSKPIITDHKSGRLEISEDRPLSEFKTSGNWKRIRLGARKEGSKIELGEKLGKRKGGNLIIGGYKRSRKETKLLGREPLDCNDRNVNRSVSFSNGNTQKVHSKDKSAENGNQTMELIEDKESNKGINVSRGGVSVLPNEEDHI
ncbi:hypothetical protein Dsin_016350 [Dipteronia sinensis]|uniref:DUF4283 domain-containing protein n=1 Tax=Dipteronia sinensis TaxID=43782 RepID=A0AAE0AD24_9ROSI|nr:hypothetical protein Dsin_016350 [Dipteronia sinensis]